jgi:two-component system cell cycle sensor histidine kinase/response regulator CckA
VFRRYGVVVLSVALTTALRYALNAQLGTRSIYNFYFLAVTVSALVGGAGPGLAALALSALIAIYLFVPPEFAFALRHADDWIGLAAFVTTGLIIVWLTTRERAVRRQSEASEERYRDLVETSQDLIWAFDTNGIMTYVNQEASLAVLGVDATEVVGRPWAEFVPPDEIDSLKAAFAAVMAGGTLRHRAITALGKDGSPVSLLLNAIPQRSGDRVIGVTGTSVDVTEQRAQERQLELFRVFMDQSPDGILIVDEASRRILDVNQTVCQWLGYSREELLELQTADIVLPHPTMTWEERRAEAYRLGHSTDPSKPPPVIEVDYRRRDGTAVPREVGFRFVVVQGKEYIVAVARDVTDRKRLEQQLQQSLKMEGIGRLAGGIAHDFNNVLTAISGYTELALETLGEGHPVAPDLTEVRDSAARAAALTRQLLAFARKQVIQPRLLSITELVHNLEGMLGRLLGEDIRLNTRLADDLWTVSADPGQLEQILVNLAVNARDAMPRGGTLTFETANVALGTDYAEAHPDVTPGEYVQLTVSDTGVGMSETVQRHIFEPFFTTKEPGKGTGLGLATCHGIVNQSGGHIWLYSEPGRGTTFKIYFPHAVGAAEPVPQALPRDQAIAGGTETILLVEDDRLVRRFATAALQRLGYQVIAAETGDQAIRLAEELREPVDLLFTDVVMPGTNGPEVARRVRAVHPAVRVLYTSGYTDDAIVHHGVAAEGMAFLQKPYSPADVTAKVRAVLDAPADT